MLYFPAYILPALGLTYLWANSDFRVGAKVLLTLLYAASWGLLLVANYGELLVLLAQVLFLFVLGCLSFRASLFRRS